MFRPDLATSLNTLSIRLDGLGPAGEGAGRDQRSRHYLAELAARWRGAYDHELEQSLRVVT
jgi:hypothetical protein